MIVKLGMCSDDGKKTIRRDLYRARVEEAETIVGDIISRAGCFVNSRRFLKTVTFSEIP